MAVNFPNAPTAGQTFISGKTLWTYTNGAWRASPLPTALPFNYIVNPSMVITQQTTAGTGITTTGGYPADQWLLSFVGSPNNRSCSLLSITAPRGSKLAIYTNTDNGP